MSFFNMFGHCQRKRLCLISNIVWIMWKNSWKPYSTSTCGYLRNNSWNYYGENPCILRRICPLLHPSVQLWINWWSGSRITRIILVGGWATPLKNMSSSIGMMRFPIYGKIKLMFQTTNQNSMSWHPILSTPSCNTFENLHLSNELSPFERNMVTSKPLRFAFGNIGWWWLINGI